MCESEAQSLKTCGGNSNFKLSMLNLLGLLLALYTPIALLFVGCV
jgi:hypothetical protein